MPSNLMIFDSEYISELTKAMNEACELVGEAVASLKKASLHEGWKCKECTRISENLDDLNLRLGRLDEGVNETVRVLGGSVSRFAELEAKYESQANNLSEELRASHGYTASVHESSVAAGNGTGGGAAAAATAGAGANIPKDRPNAPHVPRGNGANIPRVNISAPGMRVPNMGMNSDFRPGNINVNLPVTHIPDRPDDVAKGTKDAQEIADIAVNNVAHTITNILGENVKVRVIAPDGSDRTFENLSKVYNAGKSIVENSASIISEPSMPHTEERIAMAAGLVSLAGSTVTGIGMLKTSSSVGEVGKSIKELSKKAEDLLPSVKNNDELKNVLGAISAAGGSSSGAVGTFAAVGELGSSGDSFFDKLMKIFFGENTAQSQASSSSPVQEFLDDFVADLA